MSLRAYKIWTLSEMRLAVLILVRNELNACERERDGDGDSDVFEEKYLSNSVVSSLNEH